MPWPYSFGVLGIWERPAGYDMKYANRLPRGFGSGNVESKIYSGAEGTQKQGRPIKGALRMLHSVKFRSC